MTRAEAMKIILNALGIQVENNLDPEFDDVTENDNDFVLETSLDSFNSVLQKLETKFFSFSIPLKPNHIPGGTTILL